MLYDSKTYMALKLQNHLYINLKKIRSIYEVGPHQPILTKTP